jgi:hypothetical protein
MLQALPLLSNVRCQKLLGAHSLVVECLERDALLLQSLAHLPNALDALGARKRQMQSRIALSSDRAP